MPGKQEGNTTALLTRDRPSLAVIGRQLVRPAQFRDDVTPCPAPIESQKARGMGESTCNLMDHLGERLDLTDTTVPRTALDLSSTIESALAEVPGREGLPRRQDTRLQ